MTIPDEALLRAIDAMGEMGTDCVCESCNAERLDAALPILRSAIRAELVHEMIADAEDNGRAVVTIRSEYEQVPIGTWLRTYLPESEPQP